MTDADQLLKQFGPKELKAITADLQVHGARFNPTGDLLAAGGYDGRVRLWNVSGEEPLEMESLTPRGRNVTSMILRSAEDLLEILQ